MKRKVTIWEQSTPSMAMSSRCVQCAIICQALFRENLPRQLEQGFEGFLSSKDVLKRRTRAFKVEDRAFSLSSKTSYAVSCMTSHISLGWSLTMLRFACTWMSRSGTADIAYLCRCKCQLVLLQTSELQQAEEATMQDGERPHIGRSARHASKVRQSPKQYSSTCRHTCLQAVFFRLNTAIQHSC